METMIVLPIFYRVGGVKCIGELGLAETCRLRLLSAFMLQGLFGRAAFSLWLTGIRCYKGKLAL